MDIYSLPRSEKFGAFRQYVAGKRAHCDHSPMLAADFFFAVHAQGGGKELTSGHLDWYIKPIEMVQETPDLFANPSRHALDLGTGQGAVCRWLYEHGWYGSTEGVDFIKPLELRHRKIGLRHKFMHADMNNPSTIVPSTPPDLITAVNSLVFVEDPRPLLRRLHDTSAPGAMLFMIDPCSSWYWEKKLRCHIRNPGEWKALFVNSGWAPVREARTAIFGFGGQPVFPFAQAHLCARI